MQDEAIRILVVDDDEVDRLVIGRALKKAGISIKLTEACDYSAAIAILEQESFDCIFIDYRLPDKDGLALVQDLRGAGIDTPLVILTGQADDQIAVELIKAGASDYLSKDRISSRSLSRRLQNVIRIHQANVEATVANQKLRETEERFRFVLEGANDGIWDWTINTGEIYWNDRLLDILGFRRSQIDATFKTFCELVHPDDRQQFQDAIDAHLNHNKPFDMELRFRDSSGADRYCIVRGKAQRNIHGCPTRMAGVVVDITERKRAEEELAAQNELLKRTIQDRDAIAKQREDFVSRLTHDLRTPLIAADRMFQLIQDGMFGDISPSLQQAMATMVKNNKDLLQMVNNLLEVYRHEAGRKELTLSPFDIQSLLQEVVDELNPLACEKGLTLKLHVEPDSDAFQSFVGDRLELRRVLTNLVGNAIKFTQQGTINIRMAEFTPSPHCDLSDHQSWVEIDVQDTGPGISSHEQQEIFKRFRQGRERRSGSGLGLHLSRIIVEEHQGSIEVNSDSDEGSVFTVRLPIRQKAYQN
ncbi:MAG: ATP-binding protein [Elainellaceae cyanobacterium]